MQILAVNDDGTTTVELTDAEAHALRNVLRRLTGSPAAHQLQRLLAYSHGESPEDQANEEAARRYLDSHA